MKAVSKTCIQTITIASRCISQGRNPDGVTKRLGASTAFQSLSVKRAAACCMTIALTLVHVAHAMKEPDTNPNIIDFEENYPTIVLSQTRGRRHGDDDTQKFNTGDLPIQRIELVKALISSGGFGSPKEYTYSVHLTLAGVRRKKDQRKHEDSAKDFEFNKRKPLKLRINKENFGNLKSDGHKTFFENLLGGEEKLADALTRMCVVNKNHFNLRFNSRNSGKFGNSKLNFKWDPKKRTLTLTSHLVEIDELHEAQEEYRVKYYTQDGSTKTVGDDEALRDRLDGLGYDFSGRELRRAQGGVVQDRGNRARPQRSPRGPHGDDAGPRSPSNDAAEPLTDAPAQDDR